MRRHILYIILTLLILSGCKNKHDFAILQRHEEDTGTAALFVYTNSSDSIEILNYSESLRKSLKDTDCVFFFHFCHDSAKIPTYYKGKISHDNESFAVYSNINEKWKGIKSAHLTVLRKN